MTSVACLEDDEDIVSSPPVGVLFNDILVPGITVLVRRFGGAIEEATVKGIEHVALGSNGGGHPIGMVSWAELLRPGQYVVDLSSERWAYGEQLLRLPLEVEARRWGEENSGREYPFGYLLGRRTHG